MNNIDLTYIIPLIGVVLSFIIIILFGKKLKRNKEFKLTSYLPLFSVIIFLIGVFVITDYYEAQLNIEKEKLNNLEKKINLTDSIIYDNEMKTKTLDSLKQLKKELNDLLNKIEKREKITGERSGIKEEVSGKISSTNNEIGLIESYNEIIENPIASKGYKASGNTSNFIFKCPSNKQTDYIDLKLKFQDEMLIQKIAAILIKVTEVKDNKKNYLIFSQSYKPKKGVNAFKIKNYLRQENTTLQIGYVLKSEIENEYPRFEKITCN